MNGSFIESNQPNQTDLIQNVVIDSRSPIISSATLFILLQGNKTHGKKFVQSFQKKGGNTVLTNSQLDDSNVNQIVVEDSLVAMQALARYHREKFNIPVIGITGSNGKTTVKEWLYFVLKDRFNIIRSPKSYNSQIGVPLSIFEMDDSHEVGIFEAGISRPGEMSELAKIIQPTIGVFTGIGDAHNEGFDDNDPLIQKKNEKFLLFETAKVLFEMTDEGVVLHCKDSAPKVVDANNFPIPFNDQASRNNAEIVSAVAQYFKLDKAAIKSKLVQLPVISMRLEKSNGKNGNVLINDAYSLDEKSLEIGLQVLKENATSKQLAVFIAEDATKTNAQNTLLRILEQSIEMIGIDKVVYFGNPAISENFPCVNATYATKKEFFDTPYAISDCVILFTGSRIWGLEEIVNYYTAKKHITQLRINFTAIRSNLNHYRSLIDPHVKLLAMVKAQSYGGGIIEMAQFLEKEGVYYLGVAYADEGVVLRKAGIHLPILVMNPEAAAFDDLIAYQLEPSIYSHDLLDRFIHQLILKSTLSFPIHIKLDTGMNRLGFRENDMADLINALKSQPEVYVKSVFSHLSVADNLSEMEYTQLQIERFIDMSDQIETQLGYPVIKHIANSAGALYYKDAHFDMIRLGIGMYGLLSKKRNGDFENAIELYSQISQVREIEAGESVGYGRSFKANKKMRIGIVPIGYGDGLRRQLSDKNWSLIVRGKKYPIIGKICMDMCMIDISDSTVKVGDEVLVFGQENSIIEMSKILDTIPYEIISSISSRVQRIYYEE